MYLLILRYLEEVCLCFRLSHVTQALLLAALESLKCSTDATSSHWWEEVPVPVFQQTQYFFSFGSADNQVMIWDDNKMRCIAELKFNSDIRAVKLRRDKYSFVDLLAILIELLLSWTRRSLCTTWWTSSCSIHYAHRITQMVHILVGSHCLGIVALCPNINNYVLAFPGDEIGQIKIIVCPSPTLLCLFSPRRDRFHWLSKLTTLPYNAWLSQATEHDWPLPRRRYRLLLHLISLLGHHHSHLRHVYWSDTWGIKKRKGKSHHVLHRVGHCSSFLVCRFSSTGEYLACTSSRNTLHVYKLKEGIPSKQILNRIGACTNSSVDTTTAEKRHVLWFCLLFPSKFKLSKYLNNSLCKYPFTDPGYGVVVSFYK